MAAEMSNRERAQDRLEYAIDTYDAHFPQRNVFRAQVGIGFALLAIEERLGEIAEALSLSGGAGAGGEGWS